MMSKKVVVVIPLYQENLSEFERLDFYRAIKVFDKRQICILAPFRLSFFVNELIKCFDNITVELFSDKYFKSVIGYNRLLMSIDFYKRFKNFQYLLICQLDVYVFKDELDVWIDKDIDNVGAPIFEGYSLPTKNIKKMGNNGGFCLRKVESCLKVLTKIRFRYYKISTLLKLENRILWKIYRVLRDGFIFNYNVKYLRPVINEDIFWSVIVPIETKSFTACDPKDSMYFSFDANPKLLYDQTAKTYPMAIHAWWRYDKSFVEKLIKEFN